MKNIAQEVLRLAGKYHPDTVLYRHHIHREPELSFEEYRTAQYIESKLSDMGIASQRIAHTGVQAVLYGSIDNGTTLALRADMDALPIQEENDTLYRSVKPGIMHACGHDVHAACLMTVGRILFELKSKWKGKIKLIFQPAEEKFPGGASILIKEGVLNQPKVNNIIAQHVFPDLEAGKLGFRSGPFMASADEIYLTVSGKSGHGAMPHHAKDSILIAAHIVVALQQIVSRNNNPLVPSVLTIGKINSTGGATNIIPGEVKMEGTFRTFDEVWRKEAWKLIIDICHHTALAMGGQVTVDIKHGYPVLQNEERLCQKMKEWAILLLGADKVVDLPMRTTAEDFAYYSQIIPACFYRLGTAHPGQEGLRKIHTPHFDINEEALLTGPAFMAFAAIQGQQ